MNTETWKKVSESNLASYYVSNMGQCMKVDKRTLEGKVTNGRIHPGVGYMQFAGTYVHRLVAKAFIPNPNGYEQVDHINSDRTDNRVENLRWVTRKQNNSTPHARLMKKLNYNFTSHKN